MPITETFDPHSPEVISPAQTNTPIANFPQTMVVAFQPRTFSVLLDQYLLTPLGDLQLEESDESSSNRGHVYAMSYDGCRLGVYLSHIGAPSTVASLEKAIAYGTKRFVVFGTCGALIPDLATGGLIVPTAARRDEGTSYHYAPSSDDIIVSTAERTASILGDIGIPHILGKVWTTDAFFRETQVNVAARVNEGCIAVDMETSALAALAQFRGVAIHHFLYTADTLADATWDPGILGTLPTELRARYVRIALELAVRLERGQG